MLYSVAVSEHAYWRAAERFPGFDTVLIEDEIFAALTSGRISPDAPPGVHRSAFSPDGLFVWTEDGQRVYTIRVSDIDSTSFVVVTVLRAATARV